jgi:hypothetical protein
MICVRSVRWFLGLWLGFLAVSLQAQDIQLVGNTSWFKSGGGIQLFAERIQNNESSGTSGRLRLRTWATTNVDDGIGDLVGYVFGTLNVGTLNAGSYRANVGGIVHFVHPPPGIYYTTMTLEEDTVNGYVIVDSVNYEGAVNFGGFGEGNAHFNTDNGDVSFVGDVSWLAGNNKVKVYAEQILNARESGRSGILRLRLWATSTRYNGGDDILQGYPMMTKRVGRVNAGQYISNYSRGTTFHPPPPGEYYVTMTLEEYVSGLWNIVDYITFVDKSLF